MRTWRRTLGVALAVAFTLSGLPLEAADSPAEAAVRKLEGERTAALISGDAAFLERIYSNDLTYMHASGVLDNKTTLLVTLTSGKLKYKSFEETDLRVRAFGDAAVITGKAVVRAQRGEEQIVVSLFLTGVYAKEKDGLWRMVSWQTTRLPE